VHVSLTTWVLTIVVVAAIFVVDFLVVGRRPHVVSIREASVSVVIYIALAAVFGAVIWATAGLQYAAEFAAGYITELSLSVDNLFVFVVIMSAFAVPQIHQLKVLQLGIIGALVLRFAFIAVGAVALEYFTWLFFIFGAFLVWTAWKLASGHGTETDPKDNPILRRVERVLPTTNDYHGGAMTVRLAGKRVFTPLAIVMVAIFVTDIMFALDSIPAIFGLTSEPYIVVTANAFALMGLRQMYFLLDGLLDRLIYLSVGLAVVLGFIGVKLILHAAHEYGLPAPDISTPVSLIVIVATLTITVIASLAKVRKEPTVYATHDVTGHHHPAGAELEALRARRRRPDTEPTSSDIGTGRQGTRPDGS
jgi:tellurite resistance protein TerC